MKPPLDGILVVALEQAVAVPFATRQLADLGARVTKIERPTGGDFARVYDMTVRGMSSHFVWLNRGKESLTRANELQRLIIARQLLQKYAL
jgi:itaconate CoA-transferase